MELTQAPGGGTSIGQGLQKGMDFAEKDKMAIESLKVPGIREAMGDDVVNYITKGPGAHQRLGAYMAQQDKLSGGRVSATNSIVQNVSRRLEGRKDVPRDEVLAISLEEAQVWNQQNPDKAQFTQPEIEKTFNMMIPKSGAARSTAKGGTTKDPKAGRLKELSAIESRIVKLKRGDTSESDEAMIRLVGERDPAKAERLRGIITGPEVDITAAIKALEEHATYLRGQDEGGQPTGGGGEGVKVRNKETGKPGTWYGPGPVDPNKFEEL